MSDKLDLGMMTEGVVEIDPMTGRLVLRVDKGGSFEYLDVQEVLQTYQGQEVRFILTPMASIAKLAQMVEGGSVSDQDLPKVPKFD